MPSEKGWLFNPAQNIDQGHMSMNPLDIMRQIDEQLAKQGQAPLFAAPNATFNGQPIPSNFWGDPNSALGRIINPPHPTTPTTPTTPPPPATPPTASVPFQEVSFLNPGFGSGSAPATDWRQTMMHAVFGTPSNPPPPPVGGTTPPPPRPTRDDRRAARRLERQRRALNMGIAP